VNSMEPLLGNLDSIHMTCERINLRHVKCPIEHRTAIFVTIIAMVRGDGYTFEQAEIDLRGPLNRYDCMRTCEPTLKMSMEPSRRQTNLVMGCGLAQYYMHVIIHRLNAAESDDLRPLCINRGDYPWPYWSWGASYVFPDFHICPNDYMSKLGARHILSDLKMTGVARVPMSANSLKYGLDKLVEPEDMDQHVNSQIGQLSKKLGPIHLPQGHLQTIDDIAERMKSGIDMSIYKSGKTIVMSKDPPSVTLPHSEQNRLKGNTMTVLDDEPESVSLNDGVMHTDGQSFEPSIALHILSEKNQSMAKSVATSNITDQNRFASNERLISNPVLAKSLEPSWPADAPTDPVSFVNWIKQKEMRMQNLEASEKSAVTECQLMTMKYRLVLESNQTIQTQMEELMKTYEKLDQQLKQRRLAEEQAKAQWDQQESNMSNVIQKNEDTIKELTKQVNEGSLMIRRIMRDKNDLMTENERLETVVKITKNQVQDLKAKVEALTNENKFLTGSKGVQGK